LSEPALQDILEMLRTLYAKLQITKKITDQIRDYVDNYSNMAEAHAMIADYSAEMINRFIQNAGFDFFSEAEIEDLKQANEKNGLGLVLEHRELSFESDENAEVAGLFAQIDHLPELLNQTPIPLYAIKNLPNFRNYQLWRDRLKVGFVSVCDIPNYDVQANGSLKVIIEAQQNYMNNK
jgi:hypothetical protein